MSSELIQHRGVIISMKDGVAKVKIIQTSACSACHAKGVCTAAEQAEKIVEAEMRHDDFSLGDEVNVVGQKNLGLSAVLLAYVLPFILIVACMVILSKFLDNELWVGTISLSMLLPYFLIMRLFKKKISAKFRFYITEL